MSDSSESGLPRSTASAGLAPQCLHVCYFSAWTSSLVEGRSAGFGGAETELWTMARALAAVPDVSVSLVTVSDTLDAPLLCEGVAVKPVRPTPALTAHDSFARRKLEVVKYLFRVFNAVRKSGANVVFAKLASLEAIAAWTAARVSGAPFVFRVEHDWETEPLAMAANLFRGSKTFARAFTWCLRRTQLVVCQTERQQRALERSFGVGSVCVPNAHVVPPADLADLGSRDRVLWVGRAHPMKRPMLFLDLAEAMPDARFVMILAPFEENRDLFESVRGRALSLNNVEFVPGAPFGQMASYYRTARAFVLTSEAEGYSNVIIEAFKHCVPVVSMSFNPDNLLLRVGSEEGSGAGNEDQTCSGPQHPGVGYCTEDSPESTKTVVARLLNDEPFHAQCAARAYEYAHGHFDVTVVRESYLTLLGGLAKCR